MKVNKWTLGLAAVGLVSLPSLVQAEEKPSSLLTALSSTTISGYVNTDATWKPGTGNAGGIPGRAFDAPAGKQDGFNLNVVSLKLAKPLDETQWAAGYTAQLWFGPDAAGFNTSAPNISGAGGDMAVKQAYIEFRAPLGNGLDFKMGRSLKLPKVPHNRLLLALANGFGHRISKFGNPDFCGAGALSLS